MKTKKPMLLASKDDEFQLQKQSRKKFRVYRCMKASAIAWLNKIEPLDYIKKSNKMKEDGPILTKD